MNKKDLLENMDSDSDDDENLFVNLSREPEPVLENIGAESKVESPKRETLETTKESKEFESGRVRLNSLDYFMSRDSLGSFSWIDKTNHNYQLPSYGLYLFSTTGNSTYKRLIIYVNYINDNVNEITYAKFVNYYNKYWTVKINQNNLSFGLWWGQLSVNEGKTDNSDYSAYIVPLIKY